MDVDDEKQLSIAIYKTDDGSNEVIVRFRDNNGWLTQSEMAETFSTKQSNISQHINNIFNEGELQEEGNIKKINNGSDKPTNVYSLDVAISVGYRVNSTKATHFRKWATKQLKELTTKGYVLDIQALADNPEKIKALVLAIRNARTSEKNLYQKVKDVFKESSSDYDGNSQNARSFFAMAQDKFYYAIIQKTAAEILLDRASAEKPSMGLTTHKNDQPTQDEALTAKNYLTEEEHHGLMNIAEQFMLFAETKAFRGQRMTMEELTGKLNALLAFNDYPVLYEYKEFKRAKAEKHVKDQYKKYRKALPVAPRKPFSIKGTFQNTLKRLTRVKPPKEDDV